MSDRQVEVFRGPEASTYRQQDVYPPATAIPIPAIAAEVRADDLLAPN